TGEPRGSYTPPGNLLRFFRRAALTRSGAAGRMQPEPRPARRAPGDAIMRAGSVESRLEQVTRQEAVFAPLIIEPEGVAIRQEVIAGVPVEWTEPAGGPTDPGL